LPIDFYEILIKSGAILYHKILAIMNTKFLFSFGNIANKGVGTDHTLSYIIGGIVALMILGYLIYTLLHPEKF
jgi:K+-transporting ATPase KdpF subunit